jgi:hypothetical protein
MVEVLPKLVSRNWQCQYRRALDELLRLSKQKWALKNLKFWIFWFLNKMLIESGPEVISVKSVACTRNNNVTPSWLGHTQPNLIIPSVARCFIMLKKCFPTLGIIKFGWVCPSQVGVIPNMCVSKCTHIWNDPYLTGTYPTEFDDSKCGKTFFEHYETSCHILNHQNWLGMSQSSRGHSKYVCFQVHTYLEWPLRDWDIPNQFWWFKMWENIFWAVWNIFPHLESSNLVGYVPVN